MVTTGLNVCILFIFVLGISVNLFPKIQQNKNFECVYVIVNQFKLYVTLIYFDKATVVNVIKMCVVFYRNISQMTDREDMSTHTVLEDIDVTGVLNYN